MKVYDSRSRVIGVSLNKPGKLIDTLLKADSILWPSQYWPRDKTNKDIQLGAIAGHGDTKYKVVEYIPGEKVIFEFMKPANYVGTHGFEIDVISEKNISISHTTNLDLSFYHWLMWNCIIFWVHRSLIENSFDEAEEYLSGKIINRQKWPFYVYIIRHSLGFLRIVKHFLFKALH